MRGFTFIIVCKTNFGILCLTPTKNVLCKKKSQQNPFIKNPAGTKKCYIDSIENNAQLSNYESLIRIIWRVNIIPIVI